MTAHLAHHPCSELERLLRRKQLDLRSLQKVIEQSKALEEAPPVERSRHTERLKKALEQLHDLAAATASRGDLSKEMNVAARLFMLRVRGLALEGGFLAQALAAMALFVATVQREHARSTSMR